jgi:hypothetical protein
MTMRIELTKTPKGICFRIQRYVLVIYFSRWPV